MTLLNGRTRTYVTGVIETKRFDPAPELSLGLVYVNKTGYVELVDIDNCYPDTEYDPVCTSSDENHESEILNSLKHGGIKYQYQPAIAIWDNERKKWRLLTGRTRWKCYKELGAKYYPVRKVQPAEGFTEEQAQIAASNVAGDGDSSHEIARNSSWISTAITKGNIMRNGNAWYIDQPRLLDGSYDYTLEVWYDYYNTKPDWLQRWGNENDPQNFPKKMFNKMFKEENSSRKIAKVGKETIKSEFDTFFDDREEGHDYRLVNINDPQSNGTYYAKVLMESYKSDTTLVLDQYTTKENPAEVDKVRLAFVPQIKKTLTNEDGTGYLDIAYNQPEILKIYTEEYVNDDLKTKVFNRIWSKLVVYQHNWYDDEKIEKVDTQQYAI